MIEKKFSKKKKVFLPTYPPKNFDVSGNKTFFFFLALETNRPKKLHLITLSSKCPLPIYKAGKAYQTTMG